MTGNNFFPFLALKLGVFFPVQARKAHPIFFVTGELHFCINTSIIFYAMLFSFRCHNDNESFSPFAFRFLLCASVGLAGRFRLFAR